MNLHASNPDGTRTCHRHGVTYGRLEDCAPCRTDPGPVPGDEIDEPLPAPPAGCLSAEQIERALIADAQAIQNLIEESAPMPAPQPAAEGEPLPELEPGATPLGVFEPDYHLLNTIAKLYDQRTKCLRAAAACAQRREDEEIVKRREKRQRAMRLGALH